MPASVISAVLFIVLSKHYRLHAYCTKSPYQSLFSAGRLIPAHTQVLISTYSVHRDPKYWPDPDRFIPERFTPDNSLGRHPFAYIPFSAGIRNCVGKISWFALASHKASVISAQRFAMLEEKVLLASIFRRFKVRSLERPDQVRARPDLVLRPGKVIIELTPRR